MSSMSVDGLVSGLDTTSLIAKLMQAEAGTQTQLKAKVSGAQSVVTAYQSINTKFAALQTAAEALASNDAWTAVAATSSDASVAATAGPGGTTGSLSFRVQSVAGGQTTVGTQVDSTFQFAGFPIEIYDAGGSTVGSVTPTSGSIQDVAATLNGASAQTGVRATTVQVAPGQYRLQLSSVKTGSAAAFSVSPDFAASAGFGAPLQAASDAVIHVGPASPSGYDVTSTSNTFAGVLPGVTFTVSKSDADVTISTAQDPGALADKVAGFVDAANAVLSELEKYSRYDAANKTAGVLAGGSAVRALSSSVLQGVTDLVANVSPSGAGISIDRYGRATFNREDFLKKLADAPVATQATVQGVSSRLADAAKKATNSTSGTITLAINGRNDLIKTLNAAIEDWDGRLALRKDTLQRQFGAMELALSKLQSQSRYLAGALGALPSTSSKA